MVKLIMLIELEYDEDIMHGDDPEAVRWFREDIIGGGMLTLHDNGELGDDLGTVRVLEVRTPEA